MKTRLPLLLLGLLLVLAGVLACDSANPVAPNGSVLTVTANPTLISLNQTSTITVTGFKPDGNPLNPGTQVNLSTSIGVLDVTIIEIQNGRATTTLRGDGRTGTATVTASLPGGDAEATVDVQVGQTAETKPTLLIEANPTTVNLNQTSTITVLARNADGSNYTSGGTVRLRTSLGTLSDDSPELDGTGEAEPVTLTPGNEVGTATVTATLEASDEVSVDIQFGATPETRAQLLLTASPTNIGLKQSSEISILVRNPDGSAFSGDGNVRLRTSLGDLDLQEASVEDGEAIANLTNSDGESGTATVTATFEASAEATVDVQFEVAILELTASPDNIDIGAMSEITVEVRNPDGEFVGGADVVLRTTLGILASNGESGGTLMVATGTVATGDEGIVTATLEPDGEIGTATVTASLGASDDVSVDVIFGERPEERPTLTISANPSAINIEEISEITAQARNADGSPLVVATVSLRSTLGELADNTPVTDTAGQATTTLAPQGIAGMANVIGSVGSSEEVTAEVTILRTVLTVNTNPSVVDTEETSEIEVLVQDERGTFLSAGHSIQLTANLGALEDSTVVTGANGVATTTYTAGDRPGVDTITAFLSNADPGIGTITIRDFPAGITLDVAPVTFTPTTAGTTFELTVRVTNAQGEPLGNEIVRFQISDNVTGVFVPAGGPVTDSNGLAESTLRITETGIPDGVTSFTITAFVRDLSSSAVTVTID